MEIEKVILGHQYVQLKNNYRTTFINNAVPGNYSYSNATRHQKRNVVVIGDSHLNRINKPRFKNDNVEYTLSALVVQTRSN